MSGITSAKTGKARELSPDSSRSLPKRVKSSGGLPPDPSLLMGGLISPASTVASSDDPVPSTPEYAPSSEVVHEEEAHSDEDEEIFDQEPVVESKSETAPASESVSTGTVLNQRLKKVRDKYARYNSANLALLYSVRGRYELFSSALEGLPVSGISKMFLELQSILSKMDPGTVFHSQEMPPGLEKSLLKSDIISKIISEDSKKVYPIWAERPFYSCLNLPGKNYSPDGVSIFKKIPGKIHYGYIPGKETRVKGVSGTFVQENPGEWIYVDDFGARQPIKPLELAEKFAELGIGKLMVYPKGDRAVKDAIAFFLLYSIEKGANGAPLIVTRRPFVDLRTHRLTGEKEFVSSKATLDAISLFTSRVDFPTNMFYKVYAIYAKNPFGIKLRLEERRPDGSTGPVDMVYRAQYVQDVASLFWDVEKADKDRRELQKALLTGAGSSQMLARAVSGAMARTDGGIGQLVSADAPTKEIAILANISLVKALLARIPDVLTTSDEVAICTSSLPVLTLCHYMGLSVIATDPVSQSHYRTMLALKDEEYALSKEKVKPLPLHEGKIKCLIDAIPDIGKFASVGSVRDQILGIVGEKKPFFMAFTNLSLQGTFVKSGFSDGDPLPLRAMALHGQKRGFLMVLSPLGDRTIAFCRSMIKKKTSDKYQKSFRTTIAQCQKFIVKQHYRVQIAKIQAIITGSAVSVLSVAQCAALRKASFSRFIKPEAVTTIIKSNIGGEKEDEELFD